MIPRVLVIAGSDSSGGAGLEADQKVLAAHGCYAMTATTALTAQNTLGVEDVHVTPPAFVGKQIDLVLADVGCDVVKIGMLAGAETVQVVADRLRHHGVEHIVLDPVMVATSGAQLLPAAAVRNLREQLLPTCTLLTPNIPEATLLLRDAGVEDPPLNHLDDLKALAKSVQGLGPRAVLLKGGHMPLTPEYTKAAASAGAAGDDDSSGKITVDILYDGTSGEYTLVESPYLTSKNTHGTGCSLASAISAHLAQQISSSASASSTSTATATATATSTVMSASLPTSSIQSQQPQLASSSPSPSSTTLDLATAVRHAVRYVTTGIEHSSSLGLPCRGAGPIAHFHTLSPLPFSRGHFFEYLLAHPRVTATWTKYIHHAFPTRLALGTLAPDLFKSYLVQDYLYLTHFARAHALAAYKSASMPAIAASASIILHIRREMELHLSYCAEFGITRESLESPDRRESLACVAYSRYVLDEGGRGDWLALQMALAPCLVGYGLVADRLLAMEDRVTTEQGNRLWRWAENYAADDYREAVRVGRALIEEHIYKQSSSRVEELIRIFVRATEMEVRFWDFDAHPDDIDIPEEAR